MKFTKLTPIFALAACAMSVSSAVAKDRTVTVEECPAPVQAIIRHYTTQGTLEEIGVDEKKKSGGPAVYEARFATPSGKRIEVHISPEGKVLQLEEKKPKGT